MPLDQRGVWIDEIRDCDCGIGLAPAAGPVGPQAGNGQLPKSEQLPPPQPLPPVEAPGMK
jgi:hypothetical protein